MLIGTPPVGDFTFEATVEADLISTFDAGVLLVWVNETHWGKLCLERSYAGEPTVVSVVTRTVSDDADAYPIEGSRLTMRVSRIGHLIALHARDAGAWRFIRVFTLPSAADDLKIGFLVQSPTGGGCTAEFSDISFSAHSLENLRDGS